jgi:hypothetical protein
LSWKFSKIDKLAPAIQRKKRRLLDALTRLFAVHGNPPPSVPAVNHQFIISQNPQQLNGLLAVRTGRRDEAFVYLEHAVNAPSMRGFEIASQRLALQYPLS